MLHLVIYRDSVMEHLLLCCLVVVGVVVIATSHGRYRPLQLDYAGQWTTDNHHYTVETALTTIEFESTGVGFFNQTLDVAAACSQANAPANVVWGFVAIAALMISVHLYANIDQANKNETGCHIAPLHTALCVLAVFTVCNVYATPTRPIIISYELFLKPDQSGCLQTVGHRDTGFTACNLDSLENQTMTQWFVLTELCERYSLSTVS